MAEVGARARIAAVAGHRQAVTEGDIQVTWIGFGIAILAAAAVIAWAAQTASPRVLYWAHDLTEWEGPSQDFHDHLATAAELLQPPVFSPHRYPDRIAPGVTVTMHQGFTGARWRTDDPAIWGGGGRTVPW